MSDSTPMEIFAFVAGGSAFLVLFRLVADRSSRARVGARSYYGQNLPIFMRNFLALVPLWSAGGLIFGSLLLLPVGLARWVSLPALACIEAAFLLSYRVPAPYMPRWLRDEIDRGATAVARPDRMDWVLFWLVLPVIVLGDIAGPILVINS